MRISIRTLLPGLVALAVLAIVVTQTVGALRGTGVWTAATHPGARKPVANPYAPLDAMLGHAAGQAAPASVRDPFTYGRAPLPQRLARRPVRPRSPAPPPRPVLTSIVFDQDPRATIRWDAREYTVRANTLFGDFRVKSISRDRVTLERAGETIVLQLPRKGD